MSKKPMNPRNESLFDSWSIVHVVFGIAFGWLFTPVVALAILVIWEPLEIFIFSPLLARFGIAFGREALRNSLSDIFFDIVGVAIGIWLLT